MNQHNYKHYFSVLIMIIVGILMIFFGSNNQLTSIHFQILLSSMIISFFIHWIGFFPSFIYKTEKYYDIIGTLAYMSILFFVYYCMKFVLMIDLNYRSLIVMLLVIIWAFRLGSFLFYRVLKEGKDRRFSDIKKSFSHFFMAFSMSGLWVVFTLINALTMIINNHNVLLDLYFIIGMFFWVLGFSIEVISDNQKRVFRLESSNSDLFISSGLWSISRHPNYLGEILLWFGISIITLPSLYEWQFITLLSPVFVWVLLTKISGINLLDEQAELKWGSNLGYQRYKALTPKLWPYKLFR